MTIENLSLDNQAKVVDIRFRWYADQRWYSSFRLEFSKYNFAEEKMFEVRIEVHKEIYQIFYNGKELSSGFPHRVDPSTAKQGDSQLW